MTVSRLGALAQESLDLGGALASFAESEDEDEFWLLVRDHGVDALELLVDWARQQKQSVAKPCIEAAMALALATMFGPDRVDDP